MTETKELPPKRNYYFTDSELKLYNSSKIKFIPFSWFIYLKRIWEALTRKNVFEVYTEKIKSLESKSERLENYISLQYHSKNPSNEKDVKYCVSPSTNEKLFSEKGYWEEQLKDGTNSLISLPSMMYVKIKNNGTKKEDLIMWMGFIDTTKHSRLGSKYYAIIKGDTISYQKNCPNA